MKRRRVAIAFAAALLSAVALSASEPRQDEDRSILDIAGTVTGIVVSVGEDGRSWVDAVVATGDRGTVRIRLAPPDVLERDSFVLQEGDSVRARVFSDEVPHAVHRVWNESTGTSVRLRCLHGDPLWDAGTKRGTGRRWRGGRKTL